MCADRLARQNVASIARAGRMGGRMWDRERGLYVRSRCRGRLASSFEEYILALQDCWLTGIVEKCLERSLPCKSITA